jgi:hypothetical protein
VSHATIDLDAFRTKIDYHKAHTIIASFIESKIIDNLLYKLSILNSFTTKEN